MAKKRNLGGRPAVTNAKGERLKKRLISCFDSQWSKLAKLAPNGDRSALLRQMVDDADELKQLRNAVAKHDRECPDECYPISERIPEGISIPVVFKSGSGKR